jgi:hypothetical protein
VLLADESVSEAVVVLTEDWASEVVVVMVASCIG